MALLNPVISSYTGMSAYDEVPPARESFHLDQLRYKQYTDEPAVEVSGRDPWKLLQQRLVREAQLSARKPVDEESGIRNILSALNDDEYLVD